jgi:hypothetical protein
VRHLDQDDHEASLPVVPASENPADILEFLLAEPPFVRLRSRIESILSTLLRFNAVIRKPTPVDRYQKAQSINVDHFRRYAEAHLEELFKGMDIQPFLKERTIAAMLARLRFFEYAKKYHERLAAALSHAQIAEQDQQSGESEREDSHNGNYASASTVGTGAEDAIATGELRDMPKKDEFSDTASQTSYATSIGSNVRAQVPFPPPTANLDGEPFQCPYCYLIIQVWSRQDWK